MTKFTKMVAITAIRRVDSDGAPKWVKPGQEFEADAQEVRDRLQAKSACLVDKKPATAKTP